MKGDIIFVVRKPLRFGDFEIRKSDKSGKLDELISRTFEYKHYGIEVEDGNVIHFVCESIHYMDESSIIKTDMDKFVKDGVKQVDTSVEYKYSRDEVVERAYSMLGTTFNGYSITSNNCEHFAVWCVNGTKECNQALILRGKKRVIRSSKKIKDKVAALFALLTMFTN